MDKGKINYALELAGSEHRYQKMLILLISFCWVILNFMLLGSTFVFMDPVFHCNQDFSKKVLEKEACLQIQNCELVEKFTLTSSLKLYCENEWARDLLQSIFGVGCIFGLLVMNLVSDTKSRKLALMLCLSIVFVGLSSIVFVKNLVVTIGGWSNSIPTVIVGQFIQGFGISSILPLSYAFLSDFTSEKLKPRAVIIVNTAWSFSTVMLGVFYLVSLEWYFFIVFIILIPLIAVAVLFYFFLLESPQILLLRNKKEEAMEVLQKVSKINSREEEMEKIREIIMNEENKSEKNQASVKNVFKTLKTWEFLKPLIIISMIRIIGSLNFFGTSYAFDVEGLGLGFNSMIAGFFEIISFLVLTIYINRIPRRKGIAGFYFLVFLMGLLFLFSFVKDNLIIETSLMGTSRIFSTISYTLIASVQTESFKAEIQSTAVGITEVFGLFGSMCGPLVVDMSDKIDIDPVVMISILVNFAIWPTYFLKETLPSQNNEDKKDPLLENHEEEEEYYYKESVLSQSTLVESDEN